jgi:trk system potassium uptake protein TrkA
MAVYPAPTPWIGRKLDELEGTGARVAFVTRLGVGLIPKPEMALQDGDLLHLVIREDEADAVETAIAGGPEDRH